MNLNTGCCCEVDTIYIKEGVHDLATLTFSSSQFVLSKTQHLASHCRVTYNFFVEDSEPGIFLPTLRNFTIIDHPFVLVQTAFGFQTNFESSTNTRARVTRVYQEDLAKNVFLSHDSLPGLEKDEARSRNGKVNKMNMKAKGYFDRSSSKAYCRWDEGALVQSLCLEGWSRYFVRLTNVIDFGLNTLERHARYALRITAASPLRVIYPKKFQNGGFDMLQLISTRLPGLILARAKLFSPSGTAANAPGRAGTSLMNDRPILLINMEKWISSSFSFWELRVALSSWSIPGPELSIGSKRREEYEKLKFQGRSKGLAGEVAPDRARREFTIRWGHQPESPRHWESVKVFRCFQKKHTQVLYRTEHCYQWRETFEASWCVNLRRPRELFRAPEEDSSSGAVVKW